MKAFVSVVILMVAFACAAATEYTVGGDLGWTGPPNITAGYYDSWASNKAFKGGDSLKFVWNGTHNVAIVSKQEYDDCTKVTSYYAGGSAFMFTFPTSASGMYYFICTVDSHCAGGQKFAVNVTSSGVSSSPPDSGSPSVKITSTLGSAASAMISLLALSMFS